MASAPDTDDGSWITHTSKRKKKTNEQTKNTNTKLHVNKPEQKPRKKTQLNDTYSFKKQGQELVIDRRFPRYANDDTIRSIIHQLHRQIHEEAPIDHVIAVFMKLRHAAQLKVRHPFRLNGNWHFPYSEREKKEIMGMGAEDTYEADTTYEDKTPWDLTDKETKYKFLAMIKKWIYYDKCTKEILARNARVFPLDKEIIEPAIREQREQNDIPHIPPSAATQDRKTQLQTWKDICCQPQQEAMQTRGMTSEEKDIITALLTGELELPFPPTFLKRVYNAEQLSAFTLYMNEKLHYTLHAKLAPDQNISHDLEPHAIRNLIQAGTYAPNEVHNQVTSLKEHCIGVHLNKNTRTLQISFPGKRTAARWLHWKLPFAGQYLTLKEFNKNGIRAADGVKDLPLEQQYTFLLSTVGTNATIEDIHQALTDGLQLQIQSITRPHNRAQIINDKQWKVVVKTEGRPEVLKNKTKISWNNHLLTVHHYELHSNQPCKKCYAPTHHLQNCPHKQAQINSTLEHIRNNHILNPKPTNGKKGLVAIFTSIKGLHHGALTSIEELNEILQPDRQPTRKENIAAAKKQQAQNTKLDMDNKETHSMTTRELKEEVTMNHIEIIGSHLQKQADEIQAHQSKIKDELQRQIPSTNNSQINSINSTHQLKQPSKKQQLDIMKAEFLATINTVQVDIKQWNSASETATTLTPQQITLKQLTHMMNASKIEVTGNGHCLYYAIAQGLHHSVNLKKSTIHTTTTTLKQLAYRAFQQDATLEATVASIGQFTDEEQTALVHGNNGPEILEKYWTQVINTPSHQSLPQRLWGGIDVIRWIVKALKRPIFIITPEHGTTPIALTTVLPGTVKSTLTPSTTTFESALTQFHQIQNWKQWWNQLEREAIGFKRPPIIIVHENGNHYNALICSPEKKDPITKHNWAQYTMDNYIETSRNSSSKNLKRTRSMSSTPQQAPILLLTMEAANENIIMESSEGCDINNDRKNINSPNARPTKKPQHQEPHPVNLYDEEILDEITTTDSSSPIKHNLQVTDNSKDNPKLQEWPHEERITPNSQQSQNTQQEHTTQEKIDFTTIYVPIALPQSIGQRTANSKKIAAYRHNWNSNEGKQTPAPDFTSTQPIQRFVQTHVEIWTQLVQKYQDPIHIISILHADVKTQWVAAVIASYQWNIITELQNDITNNPSLVEWINNIQVATISKGIKLLDDNAKWKEITELNGSMRYKELLEVLLGLREWGVKETLMIIAAVFPRALANDFETQMDGHFINMTSKFFTSPLLTTRGLNRICHPLHPLMITLTSAVKTNDWGSIQAHLAKVRHMAAPPQV